MTTPIAREIDALHRMTTGELAERYEKLHGQPVRTRHRAYLIRKIAWRIQADGGAAPRRCSRSAGEHSRSSVPVWVPAGLVLTYHGA